LSVNVSLANLMDTLIDYPGSKQYVFWLLEQLKECGLMDPEMEARYKKHVEKVAADDFE